MESICSVTLFMSASKYAIRSGIASLICFALISFILTSISFLKMIWSKIVEPKTAIKKANNPLINPIHPSFPTVNIIKRSMQIMIVVNTSDMSILPCRLSIPTYLSAKQKPIVPQMIESIMIADMYLLKVL